MGESNIFPKEEKQNQADKMNDTLDGTSENSSGDEMDMNTEGDDNGNDEMDNNLEDMSPEEFSALDSQLDALNSALDDIEQKNDNIHSQLLQLLQANREIRQQMQLNQNEKNLSDSGEAK